MVFLLPVHCAALLSPIAIGGRRGAERAEGERAEPSRS